MLKLEDIEALSAKAAQGLPLSDEELLGVEEWYASLECGSLEWVVNSLNELIEIAKTHVLTNNEVDRIERLVKRAMALYEGPSEDNPVTVFIVNFMKGTRSCQSFSQNFRNVNKAVMPFVIRCFFMRPLPSPPLASTKDLK